MIPIQETMEKFVEFLEDSALLSRNSTSTIFCRIFQEMVAETSAEERMERDFWWGVGRELSYINQVMQQEINIQSIF